VLASLFTVRAGWRTHVRRRDSCYLSFMETRLPVSRAVLVGVQKPDVDDVTHAASLAELGRLAKTLGYQVVTTVSQTRVAIDSSTVLGKGRLAELAAITSGPGIIESMAVPRKSKARERFDGAERQEGRPAVIQAPADTVEQPEFVIVDHELSPNKRVTWSVPPARRCSIAQA
jgi:GTPase